jgi:hypothetical protein
VWRFASPANLAAFEANPTAYAPQFGGYCALGVSEGVAVGGDPHNFAILDGRLYLASTPEGLARLVSEAARRVELARRHWPAIRR